MCSDRAAFSTTTREINDEHTPPDTYLLAFVAVPINILEDLSLVSQLVL